MATQEYQTMSQLNPKVDGYLRKQKKWHDEMRKLRSIVLDTPLIEDIKWRHPCYTFQNKNVVLIHGFKEYCALLFMKGALLKDPKGLLVKLGENTQAGRQIRFTNLQQIEALAPTLKSYIEQAIEVEKSGVKVELKKTADFKIPKEFQNKLKENHALKTAFKSLTPGRQRAYILYFSGAKQSKTRDARVEKYMQQILDGKGMDD
jgi:uncharacterized protein YdeI (YjbR/CyaY-like superfamily)